jgi:hypothetical protein
MVSVKKKVKYYWKPEALHDTRSMICIGKYSLIVPQLTLAEN